MDQVKKAVVKSVNGNGTWESQYGLLYKWEITMENGDHGQYMSKTETQTKFVVGQEAPYTYDTSKKDFHKIKPFSDFQPSGQNNQFVGRPAPKGGVDIQKMIVKQSSLKAAIEFSASDREMEVEEVLKVADQFVNWVYSEKSSAENGVGEKSGMSMADKTDLPF